MTTERDRYFTEAAALSKAWQAAEAAYHDEARRYFAIEDYDPTRPMREPEAVLNNGAIEKLAQLRDAADTAKQRYRTHWSKTVPD